MRPNTIFRSIIYNMLAYINGSPVMINQLQPNMGLNNVSAGIVYRTSTNPTVGTVTTRILPPLDNIYNGSPKTFPALGAGAPANTVPADIADRVLNSAAVNSPRYSRYDLRAYRGMGLASGAYNNPYNTDPAYGSVYSYSNQWPDGGPFPYNGPAPYPFAGPYSGPNYDSYGQLPNNGVTEVVVPDAARGFNVNPERGFDCAYITGQAPDAARGFNVDPCTGYSVKPYRGPLSNAYGGDIENPFGGLNYNPQTGCPLGPGSCGRSANPYGAASSCGVSPYLNSPYGLSQYGEPLPGNYPSPYAVSQIRRDRRLAPGYVSPFAYGDGAGSCKSCR